MEDAMYYEDYDGQDTDGFDLIGAEGEEPVPITDVESQINEFRRIYGNCRVYIYKKNPTDA